MMPHRFPLLVGVGAFRRIAAPSSVFLLVSASALTLFVEGADWPHGETWHKLGYIGPVLALVLFVSPIALLWGVKSVWGTLREAVRSRACDVELSAEGLRVRGGSGGGFAVSWSDLSEERISWDECGLRVGGPDARALVVPVPKDAHERESLAAFAETLLASVRGRVAGAPPPREPPETFRCSKCGASIAPGPRTQVECAHCRAPLRLPDELVAKVLAWRELGSARRRDEAMLHSLRSQPTARFANLVVFVGGGVLLIAAIVTTFLCGAFAMVDGLEAGLPRLHGYGPAWMGCGLVVIAGATSLLSSRRALRALTLGFSAQPPVEEGDPFRCHTCGAPLPEPAPEESLVDCAYCGTTSVRAVDAQLWTATVPLSRGPSAHAILAEVRRARRRACVLGAVGLGLLGVGGLWMTVGFRPPELDARDAVEVPFVDEKRTRRAGERIAAGPDAASLERMARYGASYVELIGSGDRLDVVVRPGYPEFAPHVEVRRLGEAAAWTHGEAPTASFARVGDEVWTFSHEGVIALGRGGATRVVVSEAVLGDPHMMEIAPASRDAAIVTTRASTNGHLRLRRLERGETLLEQQDAREVAVHPDGEQVALTVWLDERHQLALLPRLDAREGRLLTVGEGSVACPRWSPDGERLAFLSATVRDPVQFGTRYGRRDLYVIELGDMTLRRLTQGGQPDTACPAWGDDGIYIVTRERPQGEGDLEAIVLRVVPRTP